jgi:hypothetical protein
LKKKDKDFDGPAAVALFVSIGTEVEVIHDEEPTAIEYWSITHSLVELSPS